MEADMTAEWSPARYWRVVLSDGTLWCDTSIRTEASEALRKIQSQRVTTYPYPPSGVKSYGPDPYARMEQLWERHESQWRPA